MARNWACRVPDSDSHAVGVSRMEAAVVVQGLSSFSTVQPRQELLAENLSANSGLRLGCRVRGRGCNGQRNERPRKSGAGQVLRTCKLKA